QRDLKNSIRDIGELCRRLQLPTKLAEFEVGKKFPCLVPESFLQRMTTGDINDPLLQQVLPVAEEHKQQDGFVSDPVGDLNARKSNGMLKKYHGRALLVLNGTCAIHCRYCFRREYPYAEDPKNLMDWEPTFQAIQSDPTITEVILSGGDPLMMSDDRLRKFFNRIEQIPHVQRIRIHSRLPVVLPSRVTKELLTLLKSTRLQPIFVIHANHPAELVEDCEDALHLLVKSGIPTLNQAVLLKGVNDDAETLIELSEGCVNLGVMPYYLHQLDRVSGAGHFEVPEEKGHDLIRVMRERLPGYAVPTFVQEIPGESSKTVLPRL
ncbi:MAG: EF-P beta-lysylation protein EpmB, partial [Planctomicrobium sp.]|nr:EF-P beta-lysylation protein EpmB [Planctomicrobium sp.]